MNQNSKLTFCSEDGKEKEIKPLVEKVLTAEEQAKLTPDIVIQSLNI